MKIVHLCLSFIILSVGLGLVACGSDRQPAAVADPAVTTRATVFATETAVTIAPANLPPTVTPTIMLSTPTMLPATATNSPPTPVPATEGVEADIDQDSANVREDNRMNIQIGDYVLTATLVENSSVEALKEALSEGPITINMRDYESMEKVGSLGMDLPRNDEQITTEAGDIILFQGSAFVIYYAPNSWNFTRLGKVDNVTVEELKEILGDGSVTITLSLAQE